MEVRVVKFNIKQFIEDYIFCVESRDKEGKAKLLANFNEVFISSSAAVKVGMQAYLFNSDVARDYTELQGLATRCVVF